MNPWVIKLIVFLLSLLIGLLSVWFLTPTSNNDATILPELNRSDLCTGFSFDPIPENKEFTPEFENKEFDDRTKQP